MKVDDWPCCQRVIPMRSVVAESGQDDWIEAMLGRAPRMLHSYTPMASELSIN
jgi:hypothetical protein